jgi:chromosomal replication initiator protein
MATATENLWDEAQGRLRSVLSPDTYNAWFAPLRASGQDPNTIILELGSGISELRLREHYLELLQEVLKRVSGRQLQVKFKMAGDEDRRVPTSRLPSKPSEAKVAGVRLEEKRSNLGALFNPKNTFDTFVVGDSNKFAAAAALAVSQAPGKSYNPLAVTAGSGLGKTHLLHAVGNFVSAHNRNARILYVSSEELTNEFMECIQTNEQALFRKRYRNVDVLLVDDIQFLAGKEQIQEELFHTFNALHQNQRQVVLTSDLPASQVQGLDSRLVARFEGGLWADLHAPDLPMRMAILRKKAQTLGGEVPEELLTHLANRIRTNVRRLEGALIRVVSYAALTQKQLSLELAESLLIDLEQEKSQPTIADIQNEVAKRFNMRPADLASRRRFENIAIPRQIAIYISRQITEASSTVIGEAFGGRDHATVLRASLSVKNQMEVDQKFRQLVTSLERQVIEHAL